MNLGAAGQSTLQITPKFLAKPRSLIILCHCFMLQIPLMIKHTAVLLIWFGYCSLPSFSLVNGSWNGIFGGMWGWGFVSKGNVCVKCTRCWHGGLCKWLNIKYITGIAHLSPLGSSKTIYCHLLIKITVTHLLLFKDHKKSIFFFLSWFSFRLVTHWLKSFCIALPVLPTICLLMALMVALRCS